MPTIKPMTLIEMKQAAQSQLLRCPEVPGQSRVEISVSCRELIEAVERIEIFIAFHISGAQMKELKEIIGK